MTHENKENLTKNPFQEITSQELGVDPFKNPDEFYEAIKQYLMGINIGVIPSGEQDGSLRQDIEPLLFCGFEGSQVKQTKTFGDKREMWAITGEELRQAARIASETGQWPIHSTVGYATTTGIEGPKQTPAIVVFDGSKLINIGGRPSDEDAASHTSYDQWTVKEGLSMDDAVIAVIYL